jgi:hypothetical protein
MNNRLRRRLRLGVAALLPAAFGAQMVLDYRATGEYSLGMLGVVLAGLAAFFMIWWLERRQDSGE